MAGTYRAYTASIGLAFLVSGLAMMGIGIALWIVPTGALTFSWLCIVGGSLYLLVAVFGLGVVLVRPESPKCPHCAKEIDVRVETMSGRLKFVKSGTDR